MIKPFLFCGLVLLSLASASEDTGPSACAALASGGSGTSSYRSTCYGTTTATGSTCTLSCTTSGYTGSVTKTCNDGSWSESATPTCTPNPCSALASGGQGSRTYTSSCSGATSVVSGSSCTLDCSAEGYHGSVVRTCNAGSWSFPAVPTCNANSCGALNSGGSDSDSFESSCDSRDSTSSGSSCILSCSTDGYSGSVSKTCINGVWGGPVAPQCLADRCHLIPSGGSGTNTFISSCASSTTASGFDCTLTCSAAGYMGQTTRSCNLGVWEGPTTPTCTFVQDEGCTGTWSGWSPCPVSCGGVSATQARVFYVDDDALPGQEQCIIDGTVVTRATPYTQTQSCGATPCPSDCVGSWTSGECSATCGAGSRTTTYLVTSAAVAGGNQCGTADGTTSVEPCNTGVGCPVNCAGEWTSFTTCSKTCGGGFQTKTFRINTYAQFGGNPCEATNLQTLTQACNSEDCDADCDGTWATGTCSSSCGGGVATKSFTMSRPQSGNGQSCPIDETVTCNTFPCPVNCVGAFGPPTACSLSCGGGTQTRTYSISTSAVGAGQACPFVDNYVQHTTCNTLPCPGACVGHWGPASPCTASCNGGTQTKTYIVSTPATNNGAPCPFDNGQSQTQSCNEQSCAVDCQGSWGSWGECSTSCGGGTQTKSYAISRPAANGGARCEAAQGELRSRVCNADRCAVNCAGSWSSFTPCSLPCGGGTQEKVFTVSRIQQYGGNTCAAASGETFTRACNTQACAVNCVGSFGAWSDCSASCAGGIQTRTYTVETASANGGTSCPMENGFEETQACNTANCPATLTCLPSHGSATDAIEVCASLTTVPQCNGIEGGTIRFRVATFAFDAVTDENGSACGSVTIQNVGVYPIEISFPGMTGFESADASCANSCSVTVVPEDVRIVCTGATTHTNGQDLTLSANFVRDFGNAVDGNDAPQNVAPEFPITFTLPSGRSCESTFVSGVGNVCTITDVIEVPGVQHVVATYPGDAHYEQTSVPAGACEVVFEQPTNLVCEGDSVVVFSEATICGTLSQVPDAHTSVANQVLVITVDGQTFRPSTDASGKACINHTPTVSGVYDITVTFEGNGNQHLGTSSANTCKLDATRDDVSIRCIGATTHYNGNSLEVSAQIWRQDDQVPPQDVQVFGEVLTFTLPLSERSCTETVPDTSCTINAVTEALGSRSILVNFGQSSQYFSSETVPGTCDVVVYQPMTLTCSGVTIKATEEATLCATLFPTTPASGANPVGRLINFLVDTSTELSHATELKDAGTDNERAEACVFFTPEATGTFPFTATFDGVETAFLLSATTGCALTVTPEDTDINCESMPDSVVNGESLVTSATLQQSTASGVKLQLSGKPLTFTLGDQSCSNVDSCVIGTVNQMPGTQTVSVQFADNEVYTGSVGTCTVDVYQPTTVTCADVTIQATDEVEVCVTLGLTSPNRAPSIVNQEVLISVAGGTAELVLTDTTGRACTTVERDIAGIYAISASYDGVGYFLESATAHDCVLTVTLEDTAVFCTGAQAVTNGNNLAVTGNLFEAFGTAGDQKALHETLTFTLPGGQSCSGVDGCTIFGIDQVPGDVVMSIVYAGSPTHAGSSSSGSSVDCVITVSQSTDIECESTSGTATDEATLCAYVRLTPGNAASVSGLTVDVEVARYNNNDERQVLAQLNEETDSNGYMCVMWTPDVTGIYEVTFTLGDVEARHLIGSTTSECSLPVVVDDVAIICTGASTVNNGGDVVVSAQLVRDPTHDPLGPDPPKIIQGIEFRFQLNDDNWCVGVGSCPIGNVQQLPGTWNIVVSFAGNNQYGAANAPVGTCLLTVHQPTAVTCTYATVQATDAVTVCATLSSLPDVGAPLVGQKLDFVIGWTGIYHGPAHHVANTDFDGQACIVFTPMIASPTGAPYDVKVTYAGDATRKYNPSESVPDATACHLQVDKKPIEIDCLNVDRADNGQEMMVYAIVYALSADGSSRYPIEPLWLRFELPSYVQYEYNTGYCEGLGQCRISNIVELPGDNQVDIYFDGDSTYLPAVSTNSRNTEECVVHVYQPTEVTCEGATVAATEEATLYGYLMSSPYNPFDSFSLSGLTLTFTVNDEVYHGETDDDGVAFVTVIPDYSGVYDVTVSFAGDEGLSLYGSSTKAPMSCPLIVERDDVQVTCTGTSTVDNGANLVLTGVITRDDGVVIHDTIVFTLPKNDQSCEGVDTCQIDNVLQNPGTNFAVAHFAETSQYYSDASNDDFSDYVGACEFTVNQPTSMTCEGPTTQATDEVLVCASIAETPYPDANTDLSGEVFLFTVSGMINEELVVLASNVAETTSSVGTACTLVTPQFEGSYTISVTYAGNSDKYLLGSSTASSENGNCALTVVTEDTIIRCVDVVSVTNGFPLETFANLYYDSTSPQNLLNALALPLTFTFGNGVNEPAQTVSGNTRDGAEFNTIQQTPGPIMMHISFAGDDTYSAASTDEQDSPFCSIDVYQQLAITCDSVDATATETVSICATISETPTQTSSVENLVVTFTIDGEDLTATTNAAGVACHDYTPATAGQHPFHIHVNQPNDGPDRFLLSAESDDCAVNVVHEDINLTCTGATQVDNGEDLVVSATIRRASDNALLPLPVTFTFDNDIFRSCGPVSAVGENDATCTIPNINTMPGTNHGVHVSFAGDDTYNGAEILVGSCPVTVDQVTHVTCQAASAEVTDTVTICAYLSNLPSSPASLGGLDLDFTIDGVAVGSGRTRCGDGRACIEYELAADTQFAHAGEYSIGISFAGSESLHLYSSSSPLENQVACKLTVIVEDTELECDGDDEIHNGDPVTMAAKLYRNSDDETPVLLEPRQMHFALPQWHALNDQSCDGLATCTVAVAHQQPGNVQYAISYTGDDQYHEASKICDVLVHQETTLTCEASTGGIATDEVEICADLAQTPVDSGTPMNGIMLTFTVYKNDVYYVTKTHATGSDGSACVKFIPDTVGNYYFDVSSEDLDFAPRWLIADETNESCTIEVSKDDTVVYCESTADAVNGNQYTVVGSLWRDKNEDDELKLGEQLTFTLSSTGGNVAQTCVTTASDWNSCTFENVLQFPGSATISVRYDGSNQYNSADTTTDTQCQIIIHQNTTLVCNTPADTDATDVATLSATFSLTQQSGASIANRALHFTVYDENDDVVTAYDPVYTNGVGYAQVEFTPVRQGSFYVVVSYADEEVITDRTAGQQDSTVYYASSTSCDIPVGLEDISLACDGATQVNNGADLAVSAIVTSDGATISLPLVFTVGDFSCTSPVDGPTGCTLEDINLVPGSQIVLVSWVGSEVYAANSVVGGCTVQIDQPTMITCAAASGTATEAVTICSTLSQVPTRDGADSSGLDVTFTIFGAGDSHEDVIQDTTTASEPMGQACVSFVPLYQGTYAVRVDFAGNDARSLNPTTSSVTLENGDVTPGHNCGLTIIRKDLEITCDKTTTQHAMINYASYTVGVFIFQTSNEVVIPVSNVDVTVTVAAGTSHNECNIDKDADPFLPQCTIPIIVLQPKTITWWADFTETDTYNSVSVQLECQCDPDVDDWCPTHPPENEQATDLVCTDVQQEATDSFQMCADLRDIYPESNEDHPFPTVLPLGPDGLPETPMDGVHIQFTVLDSQGNAIDGMLYVEESDEHGHACTSVDVSLLTFGAYSYQVDFFKTSDPYVRAAAQTTCDITIVEEPVILSCVGIDFDYWNNDRATFYASMSEEDYDAPITDRQVFFTLNTVDQGPVTLNPVAGEPLAGEFQGVLTPGPNTISINFPSGDPTYAAGDADSTATECSFIAKQHVNLVCEPMTVDATEPATLCARLYQTSPDSSSQLSDLYFTLALTDTDGETQSFLVGPTLSDEYDEQGNRYSRACYNEYVPELAGTYTLEWSFELEGYGSDGSGGLHYFDPAYSTCTLTTELEDTSVVCFSAENVINGDSLDVVVNVFRIVGDSEIQIYPPVTVETVGGNSCTTVQGETSCTLTNILETPGDQTLTATYSGDGTYEGFTDVTLSACPIKVSEPMHIACIETPTTEATDLVSLCVTLSSENGFDDQLSHGAKITWYVSGTGMTHESYTDSEGMACWPYNPPVQGSFTFTATFSEVYPALQTQNTCDLTVTVEDTHVVCDSMTIVNNGDLLHVAATVYIDFGEDDQMELDPKPLHFVLTSGSSTHPPVIEQSCDGTGSCDITPVLQVPGPRYVNVHYAGDNTEFGASDTSPIIDQCSITVEAPMQIACATSEDTEETATDEFTYCATLSEVHNSGADVSGQDLTFTMYFNGGVRHSTTETTDADGQACFTITLDIVGEYPISVSYLGSETEYFLSTDSEDCGLHVIHKGVNLVCTGDTYVINDGSITVSGLLTDADNDAIIGRDLTFTLGDLSCEECGYATTLGVVQLTPGKHILTISFAGDTTYDPITVSSGAACTVQVDQHTQLTCDNSNAAATDDVTICAYLSQIDETNSGVEGFEIKFEISNKPDDEFYYKMDTATTLADGTACIIHTTSRENTYDVTVSFAGSPQDPLGASLIASSGSCTLAVVLEDISLVCTASSLATNGQDVTVSAQVFHTTSRGAVEQLHLPLTFTLESERQTGAYCTTLGTGSSLDSCTIYSLNETPGYIVVVVSFDGDDTYKTTSMTGSVPSGSNIGSCDILVSQPTDLICQNAGTVEATDEVELCADVGLIPDSDASVSGLYFQVDVYDALEGGHLAYSYTTEMTTATDSNGHACHTHVPPVQGVFRFQVTLFDNEDRYLIGDNSVCSLTVVIEDTHLECGSEMTYGRNGHPWSANVDLYSDEDTLLPPRELTFSLPRGPQVCSGVGGCSIESLLQNPGEVEYSVEYTKSDETYSGAVGSCTLTVTQPMNLVCNDATSKTTQDVTICATLQDTPTALSSLATESLTFVIDGETIVAQCNAAGVACVTVNKEFKGDYPIHVEYTGNQDRYLEPADDSDSCTLTVVNEDTTIVCSFVDTVNNGDTITLNAVLTSEDGTILHKPLTYTLPKNQGCVGTETCVINTVGQVPGVVSVFISFLGDDTYNPSSTDIDAACCQVAVSQPTSLSCSAATDAVATVETEICATLAFVPEEFSSTANLPLVFTVGLPNGESVTYPASSTDSDGKACVTHTPPEQGTYEVYVSFAGNSNRWLLPSETSEHACPLQVVLDTITLTCGAFEPQTYVDNDQPLTVSASVTRNSDGSSLDVPLKFTLPKTGDCASGTTECTFPHVLETPGTVSVTVYFSGDNTYATQSVPLGVCTIVVKSPMSLTCASKTVEATNEVEICSDLSENPDAPDSGVANLPVHFGVYGLTQTVNTNSDGRACFSFTPIIANTYPISIWFNEDSYNNLHATTNDECTLTVDKEDTCVTCNGLVDTINGDTFVLVGKVFKDCDGKNGETPVELTNVLPLTYVFGPGGLITADTRFNLLAQTCGLPSTSSCTINSVGQTPGINPLLISFAGDATYLSSDSSECTITVRQETKIECSAVEGAEATDEATVCATISSDSVDGGMSVKDIALVFTVTLPNNLPPAVFTKSTDSTGYACVNFVPTESGTYPVSVAFVGDESRFLLQAESCETDLSVSHEDVTLSCTGATLVNNGQDLVVSAVLSSENVDITQGKALVFTLPSGDHCETTTGSCTISNILEVPGVRHVTAQFDGDVTYESALAGVCDVEVDQPTNVVCKGGDFPADAWTVQATDSVQICATLVADPANSDAQIHGKIVSFTINGVAKEGFANADGTACIDTAPIMVADTYTVAISFDGQQGDYLLPSSCETSLEVTDDDVYVVCNGVTAAWNGETITLSGSVVETDTDLPIEDQQMTFTLPNGQSCSGSGSCELSDVLDQTPGPVILQISFSGNQAYASAASDTSSRACCITVTQPTEITCSNLEVASADSVSYSATLNHDDGDGLPLAGEVVYFHALGQQFAAVTDSNGVATVEMMIPSVQSWSVAITYDGNAEIYTLPSQRQCQLNPADVAPPSINCPAIDIQLYTVAETDNSETTSVSVSAVDNWGIASIVCGDVTLSLTEGTSRAGIYTGVFVFPRGDVSVTCIATDKNGLTSECEFALTVVGHPCSQPAANTLPHGTFSWCEGAPDGSFCAVVCDTDFFSAGPAQCQNGVWTPTSCTPSGSAWAQGGDELTALGCSTKWGWQITLSGEDFGASHSNSLMWHQGTELNGEEPVAIGSIMYHLTTGNLCSLDVQFAVSGYAMTGADLYVSTSAIINGSPSTFTLHQSPDSESLVNFASIPIPCGQHLFLAAHATAHQVPETDGPASLPVTPLKTVRQRLARKILV